MKFLTFARNVSSSQNLFWTRDTEDLSDCFFKNFRYNAALLWSRTTTFDSKFSIPQNRHWLRYNIDNKHRNANKFFFLPLYRNSRQPVLWHTCINPWQLRSYCPRLALSPHLQRKQAGRAGASQSQNVLLLYRKSRKSVHTPASTHGNQKGVYHT